MCFTVRDSLAHGLLYWAVSGLMYIHGIYGKRALRYEKETKGCCSTCDWNGGERLHTLLSEMNHCGFLYTLWPNKRTFHSWYTLHCASCFNHESTCKDLLWEGMQLSKCVASKHWKYLHLVSLSMWRWADHWHLKGSQP